MRTFPFPQQYRHIAAIAALVLAVYANSLGNGFNIDDPALLLANPSVHGFSVRNLTAVLTSATNGLEYLPVRDLSYCLDFELWGLAPFGYHLSNLLYYLVACLSLYFLLRRLLGWWTDDAGTIALWAVALFAVHPVHVESVAGIAMRKDLLAGIFFFLSLLAYIRHRERGGRGFSPASLALFALALLSKGTAATLPFAIVLIDLFRPGAEHERRASKILPAVPYLLLAVVMTAGQTWILQQTGILKPGYYGLGSGYDVRIYTAFKAVMYYLRLLIVPWPLTILHDFRFSKSILDPAVLFSLAGTAALGYAAFRIRRAVPALSFSIAWLLVMLLPVIGLLPLVTVVAERYLFLPSAAFCMAAAYLLRTAGGPERKKGAALAVLLAVLAVFGVLTVHRTRAWKDPLTLYQAGAAVDPRSPRLHWLVGREHFFGGRFAEAFASLGRARELDPLYGLDLQIFAALRALKEGRQADAQALVDDIRLPQKKDVLEINYVYGIIAARSGDQAAAQAYFRNALNSRVRLGIIYRNDIEQALRAMLPQR